MNNTIKVGNFGEIDVRLDRLVVSKWKIKLERQSTKRA